MDTPERDPIESRLRDVLRSDSPGPANTESFLHSVHRGARARRRRHVAGAAAAVLLVAGGGFAVAESGVLDTGHTPVATGPSSAAVETSAPPSGSTTTTAGTTPPPAIDESVLSLTSTGIDAQWALAVTKGPECERPDGCATVFSNPVGTDQWGQAGTIRSAPTTDSSQRYAVSQLRFAGSVDDGYNGWAFGGGLLTTHGESAGEEWTEPEVHATGAVTALEAHGDTVYALFEGEGDDARARLFASPVDHDDFTLVPTGELNDVSTLVVSDHLVAFLNSTAGATEIVEQVGSTWIRSNPCDEGQPVELSTELDSLWALCLSGNHTTVAVRSDLEGSWANLDGSFAGGAHLAAVSPKAALVAVPSGLERVTVTGTGTTRLSDDDFTLATMFGFTNDQLGFVILDGRVLRTDDGGNTWKPDNVLP
jgi:hypothetical protein